MDLPICIFFAFVLPFYFAFFASCQEKGKNSKIKANKKHIEKAK